MPTEQPQRNTSWRGDLTELEIATALTRAGHKLLRPLSAASRYDLAIDNGDGAVTRIQCKTGRLRNGSVVFRAYSVSGHNTRGMPYHGQIDAFGVYCEATGDTYLVPLSSLPGRRGMVCLRIAVARNGQVRGIRHAEQFVVGPGRGSGSG